MLHQAHSQPIPARIDSDRFVPDFISLTERLIALIERENRLLEARRISEIASLIPEKSKLSAQYAKDSAILKRNSSLLGDANSPLRNEVKDLTTRFAETITAHGRLLNRMRAATEGIVEAIRGEVMRQSGPVPTYSANARAGYGNGVKPAALAFDSRV